MENGKWVKQMENGEWEMESGEEIRKYPALQ